MNVFMFICCLLIDNNEITQTYIQNLVTHFGNSEKNFKSFKPLYYFHGKWNSNNKITVLDYLGGSHYCSCSCHIQAFPSKMHQGVVAFIFCLAKVFIDVLRKSQRIFHICCMYNRTDGVQMIHFIVHFHISIMFYFYMSKRTF